MNRLTRFMILLESEISDLQGMEDFRSEEETALMLIMMEFLGRLEGLKRNEKA